MEKESFRVIFSGKLVAGRDPKQVRANLAKLFSIDPSNPSQAAKLDRLFSGRQVTVKAGLDETQANKYLSVLAKAGAVCSVKAGGQATPSRKAAERRFDQRRRRGDRRSVHRGSAIVPDRRKDNGRRNTDPAKD